MMGRILVVAMCARDAISFIRESSVQKNRFLYVSSFATLMGHAPLTPVVLLDGWEEAPVVREFQGSPLSHMASFQGWLAARELRVLKLYVAEDRVQIDELLDGVRSGGHRQRSLG